MHVQKKEVLIYTDFPSKTLSIDYIIGHLERYRLRVSHAGNLFENFAVKLDSRLELARRISGAIIDDTNIALDNLRNPTDEQVDSELDRISGGGGYSRVFYEGSWLQRIYYNLLAENQSTERPTDTINIIFTARLFLTYENTRYHARVILMGVPNIISTSGIVEAPARPKEYYWLKAGFIKEGKDIRELDEIYKGRFIEYDDSRITPVLSAYALQAVFYELTGDPFCDNPSCCLHNSHWQEEVLKAQLEGKLCEEHRDVFLRFGEM
ncbi:MAG: DUF6775 family putative metallopeptidase [Thermodesulfobacteriota bacterium]